MNILNLPWFKITFFLDYQDCRALAEALPDFYKYKTVPNENIAQPQLLPIPPRTCAKNWNLLPFDVWCLIVDYLKSPLNFWAAFPLWNQQFHKEVGMGLSGYANSLGLCKIHCFRLNKYYNCLYNIGPDMDMEKKEKVKVKGWTQMVVEEEEDKKAEIQSHNHMVTHLPMSYKGKLWANTDSLNYHKPDSQYQIHQHTHHTPLVLQ